MIKTLVLQLQYNGSRYHGWQRQCNTRSTVEQKLIEALEQIWPQHLELPQIYCAGRTDCGVHALGQVLSIDLSSLELRSTHSFKAGLNHFLPRDIVVANAHIVHEKFHARFDASWRQYLYIFDNQASLFQQHQVTPLAVNVDLNILNECAKLICGRHNFSSFQGGSCQAHSPFKTVHHAHWSSQGTKIVFFIRACGFLHHMVRYLVACQMEVAKGKKSLDWFKSLLTSKCAHHHCAIADGLYFLSAHYCKHALPFTLVHPFIDLEKVFSGYDEPSAVKSHPDSSANMLES